MAQMADGKGKSRNTVFDVDRGSGESPTGRQPASEQVSHDFDEQLNGKNRFGDEIVATTQNAVDAGFEVILAGDKDDGRSAVLRPLADFFAKRESVQLRHLDIQQ